MQIKNAKIDNLFDFEIEIVKFCQKFGVTIDFKNENSSCGLIVYTEEYDGVYWLNDIIINDKIKNFVENKENSSYVMHISSSMENVYYNCNIILRINFENIEYLMDYLGRFNIKILKHSGINGSRINFIKQFELNEINYNKKCNLAWTIEHKTYAGLGAASRICRGEYFPEGDDISIFEILKRCDCTDRKAYIYTKNVLSYKLSNFNDN